MNMHHVLKVSSRWVPHHGVDALCQLIPTELARSEPRAVFCNCDQDALIVGRAIYNIGEDGTFKFFVRLGIKVI